MEVLSRGHQRQTPDGGSTVSDETDVRLLVSPGRSRQKPVTVCRILYIGSGSEEDLC